MHPVDQQSDELAVKLQHYVAAQTPRVLTQMDRDPDSPTAGCFDRNYWHYKIRDFPSSILQQGVHTLEAMRRGQIPSWKTGKPTHEWSVNAINALSRQVDRAGGVDEYYPYERSYPASAFGLYAACRVLWDWQREQSNCLAKIDWAGLKRLARHVSRRIESQASNQQAAGLAGMALASKLEALQLDPQAVQQHADRFFASQHEEGWWDEYGGPDFGYLTVTLDALADYYDATQDDRALKATDRAVAFLAKLVGVDGRLPSTLNSRNTDYVVPYGLTRAAQRNGQAAWLVRTLFAEANDPSHFLWATDDRYHCHYVFASVVRALPYLSSMIQSEAPSLDEDEWLEGCGYWIKRPAHARWTAFVGARKGGLVRIHRTDAPPVVEFGWRIRAGKRLMVTNWWSDQWAIERRPGQLLLSGQCQKAGYHASSPSRHMVLRMLSFFLHDRVIPLLKRIMIFRPNRQKGPAFTRTIAIDASGVTVSDTIGECPNATVHAAPRQNLRHVASADSFSPEETNPTLWGERSASLAKAFHAEATWRGSSENQHPSASQAPGTELSTVVAD